MAGCTNANQITNLGIDNLLLTGINTQTIIFSLHLLFTDLFNPTNKAFELDWSINKISVATFANWLAILFEDLANNLDVIRRSKRLTPFVQQNLS